MKRLVMMAVAAGAALAAAAMPTKAELQKAQAMVNDVTAADVAALKTKAKTPAEVAAKHMELATQAGSEAEKYLLLQGAFKLYAKAGDYEGAANALGTMNREIADMKPEVIVEIYNKAIFRSMKEKAPKLHAIKEAARRQVTYRKLLAKAEAAVKANPKDAAAQKKLGECHAELGDWPKALDAFALADGALAKSAKAELDGSLKPQEIGDFWWDYESGDEMSTYKLHAAELYRTALADDSFKGLARTRADQRVKEAEASGIDLPAAASVAQTGNVGLRAPAPKSVSNRTFDLGCERKLEMIACPAGEFTMGEKTVKGDCNEVRKHRVKITRPFWLSKVAVTVSQWAKIIDEKNVGEKEDFRYDFPKGNTPLYDKVKFIEKLNRVFASELPEGYVFRLPTEAELAYAMTSGGRDKVTELSIGVLGPSKADKEKIAKGMVAKGAALKNWPYMITQTKAGLAKPNKWGFLDIINNGEQLVLDRIAPNSKTRKLKCGEKNSIVNIEYESVETDPLCWENDEKDAKSLCVDQANFWGRHMCGTWGWIETFRICLGPDLVAEKKGKGNGDAAAKKAELAESSACYPCENFGGELLTSKYEIVEHTGKMNYVRHLDRLFNCERPKRSVGDGFAFEVSAKEKEVGFTLKLSEPVTLAGLLVVNRAEVCKERQVPLCVWASEDRVKWERIFIDESVRDEYRIDLSKKNITCKYLRFGRLPGVNNEPFHLARTLVYAKKAGVGVDRSGSSLGVTAKAPTPKCKMINGRPAPLKFELAKGVDLELEGCPAGTFTMGYKKCDWRPVKNAAPLHNVRITRPFWIGKFQLTRGQFKQMGVDLMEDEELRKGFNAMDDKDGLTCAALITYHMAQDFLFKLNSKFIANLPKGYTFRLPTDAEWEYASKASDYSEANVVMKYADRPPYYAVLGLMDDDRVALMKKRGVDWTKRWAVPPGPVGLKKANAWGIYDMVGNTDEMLLDQVSLTDSQTIRYSEKYKGVIVGLQCIEGDADPLLLCDDGSGVLVRGATLLKVGRPRDAKLTFRVCLGPDLVAEKKAKGK